MRLQPPPLPSHWVARPRLGRLPHALSGVTTIVVRAPAGFGKSVLLQEWYHGLKQAGEQVAWLTVEPVDKEVDQLLAEIRLALVQSGFDLQQDDVSVRTGSTENSRQLHRLVDRLAQSPVPVVMMIDEADWIKGAAANAFLSAFLTSMPPNMRAVLASRESLGFGSSRELAAGRLHELGAQDLVFTPQEAMALFGGAAAQAAAQAACDQLAGWPVALGLASHWLRTDAARLEALAAGHTIPALEDYCIRELLEPLQEPDLQALMDVSLFEPIEPALADAVRQRDDSGLVLERLTRLAPLVASVAGPHGRLYCIHDVLRRPLLDRAQKRQPDRIRQLHRRAATWHSAQGDPETAIAHAVACGDPAAVIDTVFRCGGLTLSFRVGLGALQQALASIPARELHTNRDLRLLQSYLLLKHGDPIAARAVFDGAIGMPPPSAPAEVTDTEQQRAWMRDQALMEAFFSFELGPVSDGVGDRLLAESVGQEPAVSEALQLAGRMCQSYAAFESGNLLEARVRAVQASQLCFDLGWPVTSLYADLQFAMIEVADAALDAAEARCLGIIQQLATGTPQDNGIARFVSILLAHIGWLRDDWDAVRKWLPAQDEYLGRIDWWFDSRALFFPLLAELRVREAGLASGLQSLDSMMVWSRDFGQNELCRILEARRTILLALYDDTAQTGHEGAASLAALGSCMSWRTRHEVSLAQFEQLAAPGAWDQACTLAQTQVALARRVRLRVCEIDWLLLHGRALAGADLADDARNALDRAGAMIRATGVIQPIVRHARHLLACLEQVGASSESLRWLKARASRSVHVGLSGEQLLSPREQDVLGGIGRGASNKHIAREFGITEATVKFHIRNIFDKLGVRKRSDAAMKARQLSLID